MTERLRHAECLLWLVALPVQECRAVCCSHKTLRQWAELWLYPVCLMLHAGFATGEHMQEKQKMLFVLLLEFLLFTSH